MAQTTTSSPQQQVNMPAVDLRQMVSVPGGIEGIRSAGDLAVSQRSGGANMSVDVAAGSAYIADDHASGGGFYTYTLGTATNFGPVATADPTNPRIDRVVIRIRDAALGDAANDQGPVIVAGTPTAGATLTNLNGAAAVPASSLLLANILIPAAGTSVTTANINTTVRQRAVGPGAEMARVELASAPATGVTSTGVGDVLMTLPAFAADGVSSYEVELSMGGLFASAAGFIRFVVTESGAAVSLFARASVDATPDAFFYRFKLTSTLSAGAHTLVTRWQGDGTTATYAINSTAPGDYATVVARVVKV